MEVLNKPQHNISELQLEKGMKAKPIPVGKGEKDVLGLTVSRGSVPCLLIPVCIGRMSWQQQKACGPRASYMADRKWNQIAGGQGYNIPQRLVPYERFPPATSHLLKLPTVFYNLPSARQQTFQAQAWKECFILKLQPAPWTCPLLC